MARRPRLYFHRTAQHIIQRTQTAELSFCDADDYLMYLAFLAINAKKYNVAVHAFVLMPNHVHLLVTPKDELALGQFIQAQGRAYVHAFNKKYARSGSLWEARYKSTLVQNEHYFLAVCQFIETNPTRNKLARRASDYRWSSYRHHTKADQYGFLTAHREYEKLGHGLSEQRKNYLQRCKKPLSPSVIEKIIDATNKSWVLGDERFCAKVQAKTGIATERVGRGGDRKSMKYLESML